jgi:uncharacterized membrane protein
MRLKSFDLFLSLLIAVINVAWAFIPDHPSIGGLILALPLVFIVPGYALVEALFASSPDTSDSLPHESRLGLQGPFKRPDRFILSLGLSLALVVINGFILNILPMGLEQSTWAVSLAILTAVFSFIALYRRIRTRASSRGVDKAAVRIHITVFDGVLFVLAGAVVVSSVWYSVIDAQQQQQQQSTFTQFWMTPSKQGNDSCAVLIGIQSTEATTVQYEVVVTANGTIISTWPSITLAPQNQWYQSVTIAPRGTASVYVEAKLYRLDKPRNIYRYTHVLFNSSGSGNKQKLVC